MQTLSVLAVEDGAIIVASPAGERFRLPVDAALRARITSPAAANDEKRLSPREIQAHVRSGLTAQQVAAMSGVPVAFIERFVGPVLAERAYIVESALAVRLPPETEGARARTFGAVMGERLDALAAKDVRWTSAKEPSGWILAVGFTADDIQHSARWRFDPKHMRLDADNVEASTLSQQGVPAALTPRLRAIEPTAPVTIVTPAAAETPATSAPVARPAQLHGARVAPVPPAEPDRTRFDSAVFRFPPIEPGPKQDQATRRTPAAHAGPTPSAPTPEELTELQRRRGERQPAPEPSTDTASLPVTTAMEVVPSTGDVFAPRPVQDLPTIDRRDAAPAQQRREPTAPAGEPAPAQPRREPAPVQRLPVRAPQPTAEPVRTTPIPPAFARQTGAQPSVPRTAPSGSGPAQTVPRPGPTGSRPVPTPPRAAHDRPTEPMRRRRDRGRSGFGTLEPVDASSDAVEDDDVDAPVPATRPRRGRTSMPSWDEIVFGRDEP